MVRINQIQKFFNNKYGGIKDLVHPFPKNDNTLQMILWGFRNLPLTILIALIGQIIFVSISYKTEFELGILMLIWGTIFDLICLTRYTLIAYRIFTKGTPMRNGLLIPIELISLLWFSVSTIVTGLYFIDSTQNKTKYIVHTSFSGINEDPFFIWWYISMASITALSGTGYSSIIENSVVTSTIYGLNIALAYYSIAIILAYYVSFWAEMKKEEEEENLYFGNQNRQKGLQNYLHMKSLPEVKRNQSFQKFRNAKRKKNLTEYSQTSQKIRQPATFVTSSKYSNGRLFSSRNK